MAASPQILKKGRGWRRGLCRRVVVRFAKGAGKEVLRMDRPLAGGFLSLTALRAEGCGIALTGNEFYNAAFGGHVHIEYHNHSYPRTSLRHFVALFP